MIALITSLFPLIILVGIFLSMSVKILNEYERGVVFRLGRVGSTPKGPGLFILIPVIDKMVKVAIRTITMDIDPQDVISRDNVTLKVNAVLYFRVVDPIKAICNVENYLYATTQLSQTHLRSVLGESTMDELLTTRDSINSRLQDILDKNTDAWGIKVVSVEIKHVDLPLDMQRAMAKEAEAERERRAKIISADGELQAAYKLKEAADKITESKDGSGMQLRYLQTLNTISNSGKSTVIAFPFPMDMLTGVKKNT